MLLKYCQTLFLLAYLYFKNSPDDILLKTFFVFKSAKDLRDEIQVRHFLFTLYKQNRVKLKLMEKICTLRYRKLVAVIIDDNLHCFLQHSSAA